MRTPFVLLLAAFATQHATAEETVDATVDAITDAFPPDRVAELLDDALVLPEPWESWDGPAIEWLYKAAAERIKDVNFDRDPDRQRQRILRKAGQLGAAEANAVDRLTRAVGDDPKLLAAINTLATLNRRERKLVDPEWHLRQALRLVGPADGADAVQAALDVVAAA